MTDETAALLRELRDGQQLQLPRQADALTMQREQFGIARRPFERAEALQSRAEQLQVHSAGVIGLARKPLPALVPLIVVVVALLLWMLLR